MRGLSRFWRSSLSTDGFGGWINGERIRRMKVGDLVASADPRYVLHCGSGVYPRAVVIKEQPLVLASEEGDMRWESTVQPGKLAVVGRADSKTLARCMRRLTE